MNWKKRLNNIFNVGDSASVSKAHYYRDKEEIQTNIYSGEKIIKKIENEWVQFEGDFTYWFLLEDLHK